MPAYHLVNKKNHGQNGGSDQGNTSPGVNRDCEAGKLGSSKSETGNLMVPDNTYYGKGNTVNQRLCNEGPP